VKLTVFNIQISHACMPKESVKQIHSHFPNTFIRTNIHTQLSQEWRLVDIDDWMNGNVYLSDIPDGGDVPTEGGGEGAHGRRKDD